MGKCSVAPFASSEKPFVCGTYTGNGAASQTINLGFTPSAVLAEMVNGIRASTNFYDIFGGLSVEGAPLGNSYRAALEIVPGGFRAYFDQGYDVLLNTNGEVYRYIAFH